MSTDEQLETVMSIVASLPARRAGLGFESFVAKLVAADAARSGLETARGLGGARDSRFDLTLRGGGWRGMEAPVGIEIKYFGGSASKNLVNRLNEFAGQLVMTSARDGYSSVVLIHNASLEPIQQAYVRRFLAQLPQQPRVEVWGWDELSGLARSNPNVVETFLEDAPFHDPSLARVAELRNQSGEWIAARNKLIDQLADVFSSEGLTLFLGAGVSVSANIPTWRGLLEGLFLVLAINEFGSSGVRQKDVSDLARLVQRLESGSPLLSARYLQSGIEGGGGGSDSFIDSVAELLYRDVGDSSGELLPEIARMCQPRRTGARVNSVITYNFDDLLERELAERGLQYRTIYAESSHATRDELAVYHPHGFLPEDRSRYPGVEDSLLTFSEEGYHTLYRDPYDWSNVAQLNALRESTALFIGLSMTDPNLRRLLEFAVVGDRPRHYALLQRTSIYAAQEAAAGQPSLKVADDDVQAVLDTHHALFEQVMRQLGVNVVWYEEHGDVPNLLRSLGSGT